MTEADEVDPAKKHSKICGKLLEISTVKTMLYARVPARDPVCEGEMV
jgi:hypothetical protein